MTQNNIERSMNMTGHWSAWGVVLAALWALSGAGCGSDTSSQKDEQSSSASDSDDACHGCRGGDCTLAAADSCAAAGATCGETPQECGDGHCSTCCSGVCGADGACACAPLGAQCENRPNPVTGALENECCGGVCDQGCCTAVVTAEGRTGELGGSSGSRAGRSNGGKAGAAASARGQDVTTSTNESRAQGERIMASLPVDFDLADILPDDFFTTLPECQGSMITQRYTKNNGRPSWWLPSTEQVADAADGLGTGTPTAFREAQLRVTKQPFVFFPGAQGDTAEYQQPIEDPLRALCRDDFVGGPPSDVNTGWAYMSNVMANLYNGSGRDFSVNTTGEAYENGWKYVPGNNQLPYTNAATWKFYDIRAPQAGFVGVSSGRLSQRGKSPVSNFSVLDYYNDTTAAFWAGLPEGERLPQCGFISGNCPPYPQPEAVPGIAAPNPFFYPPSFVAQCLPGDLINFRDYGNPHPGFQRYAKFRRRAGHPLTAEIPPHDPDKYVSYALEIADETAPLGDQEEAFALMILGSPLLTPDDADFRALRMTTSATGLPGTGLIPPSIPYEYEGQQREWTQMEYYLETLLERFRDEVVTEDWKGFIRHAATEIAGSFRCGTPVLAHNFGGSVTAFVIRLLHLKMLDLGITANSWHQCSNGSYCYDPQDGNMKDCEDNDLTPSCGNGACEENETCGNCNADCQRRYSLVLMESSVGGKTQNGLRGLTTFQDGTTSRLRITNLRSYQLNNTWAALGAAMSMIPGDAPPTDDPNDEHLVVVVDVVTPALDYWLPGDVRPYPFEPAVSLGADVSCAEVAYQNPANAHFSLAGRWLYQGHLHGIHITMTQPP